MKKNNSLINLDSSAGVILLKSKAELQETAKSLKSNLDKLTEYEALYKLQFLIKERLDFLKDDAKNTFIEKLKQLPNLLVNVPTDLRYLFDSDAIEYLISTNTSHFNKSQTQKFEFLLQL